MDKQYAKSRHCLSHLQEENQSIYGFNTEMIVVTEPWNVTMLIHLSKNQMRLAGFPILYFLKYLRCCPKPMT